MRLEIELRFDDRKVKWSGLLVLSARAVSLFSEPLYTLTVDDILLDAAKEWKK
jgi:hypothetical protein